jgi:hypothetical protein
VALTTAQTEEFNRQDRLTLDIWEQGSSAPSEMRRKLHQDLVVVSAFEDRFAWSTPNEGARKFHGLFG